MIKKVNKQGKTIINKHHNNFSQLTPEQQLDMFRYFKNDEDEKTYLKGEIIIDTDPENPSIYILNNNNQVVKISGSGSNGDISYDDTEIKQLIKVVSDNLDTLRGDDINKSVRTIAEEILTNGVDLTEITENIDKLNELIGETSVESQINVKVGTLPSDKTVIDLIDEETSNRTNDIQDIQYQINIINETYVTTEVFNENKTKIEGDISDTQNTLTTLIDGDDNKSIREIATDEATKAVTNVVNGAPEAFDTLQEIAEWIGNGENISGVTASDMLVSIEKNKTDIANEIAERKESVSNIQSDVDNIKKDYLTSDDKTELSNAITAETNTRIESIDNLQSEIDTIKSNYLKDSDKQELTNSINDVVDVVTNHTETILSIQDSVNTLRGDFDTNVESVDNSFKTLTDDINSINSNIIEIDNKITGITDDINSINSELDKIDTTLENVNSDITNINSNISDINETIETINDEIVDIKEDVTNKHTETNNVISGITEEIGTIKDDISTINTNISNIDENLTTTTSNIVDIIDNQLPSINDSISDVTIEVTNIKEEISGYTETLNQISDTTNELNEQVGNAMSDFTNLSNTVSTFKTSINTNTENINTLLTDVSANTETLNVLTGDEEGSINKKINDTKAEIDTYTVNGKLISESPVLDSNDLNISTGYTITNVGERISPEEHLTTAFAKLESVLLKTTLAITAALNDLESRIGNPSEYDDDGNLTKEGSGLFKRIEDLEERNNV